MSKKSLFTNAHSVNSFLKAQGFDRWLNSLPYYHVGGLSIYFRAHLLDATVIEYTGKWEAFEFCDLLENEKISFTSIVPFQAFQLVEQKLKAPSCLKGIFVGGDFLSNVIAYKLYDLGWPVIKTYGMTELCSQIASTYYSPFNDDFLEVLSHHHIENNFIESSSLYTAKILFNDKVNIEFAEDQFLLPDDIELKNNNGKQLVRPLGRNDGGIKLKGRLYFLNDIKEIFHQIFLELSLYGDAEIFLDDDKKIILLLNKKHQKLEEIITQKIKKYANPLTDILKFRYLEAVNKTPLGKVKKIF